MDTLQPTPSAFAQMVDKLRNKSEDELKMLYLKFFSDELTEEWKEITNDANFLNATDDEIVEVIQKNRYRN